MVPRNFVCVLPATQVTASFFPGKLLQAWRFLPYAPHGSQQHCVTRGNPDIKPIVPDPDVTAYASEYMFDLTVEQKIIAWKENCPLGLIVCLR
jgi:hypothetical protein